MISRGRTRRGTLVLLCALSVLPACGASSAHRHPIVPPPPPTPASPTATAPSGAGGGGTRHPDHIVVAVFENKAYRQLADGAQAPYLSGLMSRAATFVNAHGETHPSQPNYLALFSGSTQGVTDDHCLARMHGRPNLGAQLTGAGYTFTGYSEDLPAAGYRGCRQGRYAAKHNPWVDFDNVPPAANQPYSAWPADLSRLPTVAFVVPNLCDDMHDCPVATGDRWARAHLDPYLRWADTHNSLLIVTFDENDGSPGNQILTIIAGAGVTAGRRTESINHYSLLRAIETSYGLPLLGHAATATAISGLAGGGGS